MKKHCAGEIENVWGYGKRLRFVRDVISASFPAPQELRVLDIGCGNGSQLSIPLADDPRLRIIGVDPDAASVAHGKRLAGNRENVTFICGSPDALTLDHSFEVVILSEVLEHLNCPAAMLREAKRLLHGDGTLIVTVPNGWGEFELDSWFFRACRLQKLVDRFAKKSEVLAGTDNSESRHVQFFTRSRLNHLFQQAGLVTNKESAASFLAGPIAGHFVSRSARLVDWNAHITDRLPLVMASGWYFALRSQNSIEHPEDLR